MHGTLIDVIDVHEGTTDLYSTVVLKQQLFFALSPFRAFAMKVSNQRDAAPEVPAKNMAPAIFFLTGATNFSAAARSS